MLSDTQITKFQALYLKHFGREISRDEACEKGMNLIRLVELIYSPQIESGYGQSQKRYTKTDDRIN